MTLELDSESAAMDDRDPWTIRPGAETDVPAVLALWDSAGGQPSATDSEQALARLLGCDADSLLLAEADGEVIGALIAAWDGWRGSFYRLSVHPDWRRRGIATALVRAGEDRLRGLGAERLTAIIVGDDGVAAALWEAAGYRRQTNRSRFVRMVGDG